MSITELQKQTNTNIQEKANLIWEVATHLVGPFKPHEYGKVILPMTVLKRFDDALKSKHDAVVAMAKMLDEKGVEGQARDGVLRNTSGYACSKLGIDTLPVIVRDLSREEAIIFMVDSNLQREHILPSERAKAYKMKMEAMRGRVGRPMKNNECPMGTNYYSADEVAKEADESPRQIFRYIRLAYRNSDLFSFLLTEHLPYLRVLFFSPILYCKNYIPSNLRADR